MKIKVSIKYQEGYLPSKRHKKLVYKTIDEIVDIELKEITRDKAKLAYRIEDDKYNYSGDILKYRGKLYKKIIEDKPFYYGDDERNKNNTDKLARLEHLCKVSSMFYGFNADDIREKMVDKAKGYINKYILIDNELWEITAEPTYRILTFGLGNNHAGIGTSLFIKFGYNKQWDDGWFFKAKDREKAIKKALEIATKRGDTKSIEHIKKAPIILIK